MKGCIVCAMGEPAQKQAILCYLDKSILSGDDGEGAFSALAERICVSGWCDECTVMRASDLAVQVVTRSFSAEGKPSKSTWLMWFAWQLVREWTQSPEPELGELLASAASKLSKRSSRLRIADDYEARGANTADIQRVRFTNTDNTLDLSVLRHYIGNTIFEFVDDTLDGTDHLGLAVLLNAHQAAAIAADNADVDAQDEPEREDKDWWLDAVHVNYAIYAGTTTESERLDSGYVVINGTGSITDNTIADMLTKVSEQNSSNYNDFLTDDSHTKSNKFEDACNFGLVVQFHWEGIVGAESHSETITIASLIADQRALAKTLQKDRTQMPASGALQINIFFTNEAARAAYMEACIAARQYLMRELPDHDPPLNQLKDVDPAFKAVITHPEQKAVAERTVALLEQRLHQPIEMFDDLAFLILVLKFKTLQAQTAARVQAQGVADNSCNNVDEQVLMCINSTASNHSYKTFKQQILNEPNTLGLLIDDEPHWGPTDGGAQSKFINDPELCACPNFAELLVSATGYNCLTQQSRIDPDNVINWYVDADAASKSLHRSFDYYISSIAYQLPHTKRKLRLSVNGKAFELELHHEQSSAAYNETGRRYTDFKQLAQHINDKLHMSKIDGVTFAIKSNSTDTNQAFTVCTVPGVAVRLHCGDSDSVLPLLGFCSDGGVSESKGDDITDAMDNDSIIVEGTCEATGSIGVGKPTNQRRVRQDVSFTIMLQRWHADVGTRNERRKKVPKHSKDGHLVLADYLFSLTYYSVFRRSTAAGSVATPALQQLPSKAELDTDMKDKFTLKACSKFQRLLTAVSTFETTNIRHQGNTVKSMNFVEEHYMRVAYDQQLEHNIVPFEKLKTDVKQELLLEFLKLKFKGEATKDTAYDCYYTDSDKIIADLLDVDEQGLGRMKVLRVYENDEAGTMQDGLRRGMEALGYGSRNESKRRAFSVIADTGDTSLTKDIEKFWMSVELTEAGSDAPARTLQRAITDRQKVVSYKSKKAASKVELTYEDLHNIPCIIVLCNKGRMGDTFPHSFNTLDLRLRTAGNCDYPIIYSKSTDTSTSTDNTRAKFGSCSYSKKQTAADDKARLLGVVDTEYELHWLLSTVKDENCKISFEKLKYNLPTILITSKVYQC
eukprot:2922-Heterococcus_DN1.PRE.3